MNNKQSRLLSAAAVYWYVITAIGQVLFVLLNVGFYFIAMVLGKRELWNEHLTHGYVEGMTTSNVAMAAHLFVAAVITIIGLLQINPYVRNNYRMLHRYSGRVYMVIAFLGALSGLYLTWTTGTVGDISLWLGTSLDGVLIMVFAVMAWTTARKKRFNQHRKWALRLFIVVSAVWFLRVSLMLWFLIHQRPVGIDVETFTGPFPSIMAFGQYLIPLLFLELYFYVQENKGKSVQAAYAVILAFVTTCMAAGIFAVTMGSWIPQFKGAF